MRITPLKIAYRLTHFHMEVSIAVSNEASTGRRTVRPAAYPPDGARRRGVHHGVVRPMPRKRTTWWVPTKATS